MTTTNVTLQLLQLLYMVCFAMCTMFWFDVINILRKQAKWNRRECVITDFLFVLFWGMLFCIVLILLGNGMVRNYTIFGLCIGAAIYYCLMRRFCLKICRWIAGILLWSVSKLKQLLSFPWRWLYDTVWIKIKRSLKHIQQKKIEKEPQDEQMEKII